MRHSIATVFVTAACTYLVFAQPSACAGLDDPAVVVPEDDQVAADHRVIRAIFDDEVLAENVQWFRSRAVDMSAVERFDHLTRWVLPTPDRPLFRLSGEFTQTDPAPIAGNQTPTNQAETQNHGGQIVSPVFELMDVAKELGKLQALRDRVERQPLSADELQQRSQTALLVLINLELGDRDAAEKALNKLLTLVLNSTPTTIHEVWPETLVVYRGVQHHAGFNKIAELLAEIHARRRRATIPGSELWHNHVLALTNQQKYLGNSTTHQSLKNSVTMNNWIPAFRGTAASRGGGFPQPLWIRQGRQLQHVTGHGLDYLFFPSPLRGNFQIEADLGALGLTQFQAAGQILGLRGDGKAIDSGTFQRGTRVVAIDPPMGFRDEWVRYRAVFRDGVFRAYLNGRLVHTAPLSEHHDPWVAVQAWMQNDARLRDFRITGNPTVPDSVLLSASAALTGWLPYHLDRINVENADWSWEEDAETAGQIVGRRKEVLRGTFAESLLRYQRPLLEDGSVEYDFFSEPGATEAHPTLDRLAFLLRPNGIRVHWITDGRFDRTGISPGNAFDEPQNRRGPTRLPLLSGDWNHVKLAIVGKIATVELNGQLVFERELEATNRRTFGLFHYADTELRVRNVVMRGDWPKVVPPVQAQELADPRIAVLDQRLPKLKTVFEHTFAQDGLPARYFTPAANKPTPVVTSDGLLHTDRSVDGDWAHSLLRPTFQLIGDFDVTVRFDDLKIPALHCGCGMAAYIGGQHLEIIRRRGEPTVQRTHVTFATRSTSGRFRHAGHYLTSEALAGSFRLTRRGDSFTALFAEDDSPAFRVIGEHTWKGSGQDPVTLDLRSFARSSGATQVVWKNFRIAAEELMLLPDQSIRQKGVVFVMKADGSELKQITQAMPAYQSHGSPEWSPDGKRIAFDGWTGSPSSSRVFVVNNDGTGLKDLGIGIMPTFSPGGDQLAFTWSRRGMAIMNVDGTGREVITREGWGAQWSPNGRWISYGTYDSGSGAIAIVDIKTRERRLLLEGEHAMRYSRIDHNMEWSLDSSEIVFLGHLRNGKSEVAITAVDGSSKGFRVITTDRVAPDFCWHPNNDRIMISKAGKLYYYEFKSKDVLLLPGQPMDQSNSAGVWSADGRFVAFTGVPKAKPIPWRGTGD